MWEAYRKRFVFTQLFILVVCAALRFGAKTPWPNIGVFFGCMQIGGVVGAWWGNRLAKKIQASRDRLPLDQR